ncbi:MAG: hypothetical protein U9N35_07750 [Euryarchaeota archaeon]|nr:hypothetical protein [Euryarchaeota archaeon]
MNKKSLIISGGIISLVLFLLSCCLVIEITKGDILVVPEKSLQEIDYFEVGHARSYGEAVGEKKMRKDYSVIQFLNEMESQGGDRWDELEQLRLEVRELEREFSYRKDVDLQLEILYTLQEHGKHFLGYVFWPIGEPQPGSMWIVLSADYESEIRYLKNEVELLREDLIKKEFELEKLYKKRDNTLIGWIKELRREIDTYKTTKYGYKRYVLLSTVIPYKLKTGKSLEITPPWEEGEHRFSEFKEKHVWVGMYDTDTPRATNFLGYYITDTFTPKMQHYWEEALEKNPETKSIRIKWIYIAEGHTIVWEGNKNKEKEWYTFAEYGGDPQEGAYTVVNMSLLNYPEYQQYYVTTGRDL